MIVAFTFTKSRSNLILIVKNVKRKINLMPIDLAHKDFWVVS